MSDLLSRGGVPISRKAGIVDARSAKGGIGTAVKKYQHMFYVYVLKSYKNDRLYTGQTANLEKRLSNHNNGENFSTKSGAPWNLLASKKLSTRKEAIKVEKYIKSLKSRLRIFKFIAGWSSGSSLGS